MNLFTETKEYPKTYSIFSLTTVPLWSLTDENHISYRFPFMTDTEVSKLARWNRNVMDWKHIREQYAPKELAVA